MHSLLRTSKNLLLPLVAFVLVAFAGCGEKDPVDPVDPTPAPKGKILFHLHTNIENSEVNAYNIVYTTDAEGRKVSLSLAQVYLSEIQLIRSDGTPYTFPGKLVLKAQDNLSYYIGEAPAGDYRGIRFRVGLPPAINALEPDASQDQALLNRPEMWLGATAQPDGYAFVALQGKIDTTADASGTTAGMQPFHYKIGTNANSMVVTMPEQPFTLLNGGTEYGHIIIDFNVLFAGIQLNDPANLTMTTAADNATPLGERLAANLPGMFKYEE